MKRKMITRIVAVLTLSAVMATNSMMTMGNVYANELTEGAEQQEYETLAVDSDYSQIGGIESYIVDNGYILDDVLYVYEDNNYYLRIVIDKKGLIDISDCIKVTKIIDPLIEDANYIKDSYILDVCSKEKGCE